MKQFIIRFMHKKGKQKEKLPMFALTLAAAVTAILAISLYTAKPVSAEGVEKTITTYINSVNIHFNGVPTQIQNITYENGTYVPVRDIAELLGRKIAWNDTARTINIYDIPESGTAGQTAIEKIKGILYLFSAGFLIAGAVMLAQMVFLRGRNDIAFIIRFLSTANNTFSGAKRLLYETWLSKTGFVYIIAGLILHFVSSEYYNNFDVMLRVVLICMAVFALLLLGWRITKKGTARQFPEILKVSRSL